MKTLIAGIAFAVALPLQAGNVAVLLPVDNISGDDRAPEQIDRLVKEAVTKHGWRVVSGEPIEQFIEEKRIRYLDSVDDAARAELLQRVSGDAVVATDVYTWRDGENPTVALSSRMVAADGSVLWTDVVGIAADDTERVLGFGRDATAEALAGRAVAALMRHFPAANQTPQLPRGSSKPLLLTRPATFRSGDLDPKTPHRVCILPFETGTATPEATRVVADVFAVRLAAANGFEVVEPATLRAAALKAGIASFRSLGNDHLVKLAAAVGTPLFLRGTIFTYRDAATRASSALPAIEIELELVDVNSGRVLWTGMHSRKGSDYVGFLMRGMVSNAVALTDRAVSELVAAEEHAAANAPAAPPARAASLRKGRDR